MKVAIFALAVLAIVNVSALSKGEVRKKPQTIRSALHMPIHPQVISTPIKQPTVYNGSFKEVAGCGVSAVSDEESKIYGGDDVIPNEFPWVAIVVIVRNDGTNWGGGVLINQDWALTAGHLTYGGLSGHIELGSHHRGSMDPGQLNIDLVDFIAHPQYVEGIDDNDIGLVRLGNSAPYTNTIRPICLPRYSDFVGGGVPLIISGWGSSDNGYPDILQKATVTSMTTTECVAAGVANVDDDKICTTGEPLGVGTCGGDSGGPLSMNLGKTYLVGTDPKHYGACGASIPIGFIRTTSYLSWISSVTGIAIDP